MTKPGVSSQWKQLMVINPDATIQFPVTSSIVNRGSLRDIQPSDTEPTFFPNSNPSLMIQCLNFQEQVYNPTPMPPMMQTIEMMEK